VCDHYRDLPREFSLCLDFDAIITEPMNVASGINAFLGLGLSTHNIADAVAEFERENVRRRVDALQEDFERRRATGDGDVADTPGA
jgi:predicted methyltransferase